MFTGIIEEVGRVISATPGRLVIGAGEVLSGSKKGDSMAVNGVCLTITEIEGETFAVDVMQETLARTNLGQLRRGDAVNLERPLALGGRLGGHLVEGHVDGTGRLISLTPDTGAVLARFEAGPNIMRYIVEKGFIAVDGASLTVASLDSHSFTVSLVEYTRRNTTLGHRQAGDMVNLEVDIIAKYVEQSVRPAAKITSEFLREHGFLAS